MLRLPFNSINIKLINFDYEFFHKNIFLSIQRTELSGSLVLFSVIMDSFKRGSSSTVLYLLPGFTKVYLIGINEIAAKKQMMPPTNIA
jgi:hypothetical protein